jgi:hypothetical protein
MENGSDDIQQKRQRTPVVQRLFQGTTQGRCCGPLELRAWFLTRSWPFVLQQRFLQRLQGAQIVVAPVEVPVFRECDQNL